MNALAESLINRFRNILAHDNLAWINSERKKHLLFNRLLQAQYSLPTDFLKIGTYVLPSNYRTILARYPYLISGGVEFHIEFELELSKLLPEIKIDFFDVDLRSIDWFKKKYSGNPNFHISHAGLSDASGKASVHGSSQKGWSSSVDMTHISTSPLRWERICEVNLITLTEYLAGRGYKPTDIGLLKLDIEGMADRVLNETIRSGVHPRIVLFEMERGENLPFDTYEERVLSLLSLAKSVNYTIHHVPRIDGFSSFSSDFILIKND